MSLPSRPFRRRFAPGAVLFGACLACLLSGIADAAPGDDAHPRGPASAAAAPDDDAETLRRGLADLDSPYLATREAAVGALRTLPTASRPALRAAFREAPPARRARLARVLGEGADRDDLGLLLDALVTTKDPADTAVLRDVLVEHAEESEAVIASRAEHADGDMPLSWIELSGLLERAKLEALFLSRKSLSGGTGSYDGQYAVLRPWRKPALELCIAMLAETEVRRPGVFPVGTYRFLRPPPVLVQHEEVREMAANAIAELCTADDSAILARLEEVHEGLARDMALEGEANRVKKIFAEGLDDVVLPTLVTLGRRDRIELELRVRAHEEEYEFDDAAHLRLRMKEFEEAVQLFQRQIALVRQHVIPSYNLACAYARWSEAEASRPAFAARLREGAVSALERSVLYGYADWAWMEQDLDLKAIHDTTGYRELVADLKRRFPPPSTWLGGAGIGGAGRGGAGRGAANGGVVPGAPVSPGDDRGVAPPAEPRPPNDPK